MAHQLELGSYKGEPNFLMRSRKGFCWANLPPTLVTLVKGPNMSDACEVFALGPDGHFYLKYRAADDSTKQVTSEGFWNVINHPWNGAWIERVEFGEPGSIWGVKGWRADENKLQGIFRSAGVPPTLTAKIQELDDAGSVPSYSDLKFVALGADGSWILKVQSMIYHRGADPGLWEYLTAEDRPIVNIRLSPTSPDIFWVQLGDGATFYSLPKAWNASIARFSGPDYFLDTFASSTTGSNARATALLDEATFQADLGTLRSAYSSAMMNSI